MRQNRRTAPAKSGTGKAPAEQGIKDIRRATRKQYSAEEKIRILLEGLRGLQVQSLIPRLPVCSA